MRSLILWLVVIYALFTENGILFVAAIIGTLLVDIKDILNKQTPISQQMKQIIDKRISISQQENHEKKSDTTDASN